MKRVLTELKTVMQAEIAEYQKILALAGDKKEALFANNVTELDAIVSKEWAILKGIKSLESQRETLLNRTAILSQRSGQMLTLQDIIEMVSGDMQQEFIRIHSELSALIAELKKNNDLNRGLIETQLQYASFCVNLLSGQMNSLGTYSDTGEIYEKQDGGSLRIDRSV